MLEIRNIKKEFKNGTTREMILKSVSMKISAYDFSIILGKSGSGKSTLLNILSGLDTEYEGEIFFKGVKLSPKDLDQYRKNDIGFVFQNFNLIPHMTVFENIMIPLELNKEMDKGVKENRVKELLKQLDIEKLSSVNVKNLSGGEKQRVAIARALVNNPKILVADEPTGALDEENSLKIKQILKKIALTGTAVVVVTHDEDFKQYASKVYYMKNGSLTEQINTEKRITKDRDTVNNNNKKVHISFLTILKHAFKNFKSRKKRNIFVALGTAIGVIALIASVSLNSGVNQGLGELLSDLDPKDVNIYYDATGAGSGSPTFPMNQKEVQAAEQLLSGEGIKDIYYSKYIYGNSLTYKKQKIENSADNMILFEEATKDVKKFDKYYKNSDVLLAGRVWKSGETGIILTSKIAKQLLGIQMGEKLPKKKAEKMIGQTIDLDYLIRDGESTNTYKEKLTVQGIIHSDSETAMTYSLLNEKTMDELTIGKNQPKHIYMVSGITKSAEASRVIVDKYNKKDIEEKLIVTNAADFLNLMLGFTKIISAVLVFMAILSLIVSGVMIMVVISMAIVERTREIGVLRAVGYKEKYIKLIFILESTITVLFANTIGILFVKLLAVIFNPYLKSFSGITKILDVSMMNIILTIFATSLLAVLFAYLPSRKASKINIIDALRYE